MELNKYIVVKYSELHLKGGNKKEFIRVLIRNIKSKIEEKGLIADVINDRDKVLIESKEHLDDVFDLLKFIVGISSYGFYYKIPANKDEIEKFLLSVKEPNEDKKFRLSIKVVDKILGEKEEVINWLAWFVTNNLKYKINLSNYDLDLNVRIEDNIAIIFFETTKGILGLPAGSNGRALTLLSGGIDSPVAAFKTIARGINSSFITFLTPRTSDEKTVTKILSLAEQVNKFNGNSGKLFLVNFERVQEEIMKLEDTSYRITLLRRYFMRFSQLISYRYKYKFVITGDSLGQVASQTPESMTIIDNATEQLIVRPLVSMSKNEIIDIARSIGTYDISIMEGDDMCSLFTPKNPIIHPKSRMTLELESKLENMDEILRKIIDEDMRIIDL